MASQWSYKHRQERLGPVSSSKLKELAASGQIEPSDLVWREGMAEWTPASGLKGLFPEAELGDSTLPISVLTVPPPIPTRPKAVPPPIPPRPKVAPPPVPPRSKGVPPPVPPRRQPADAETAHASELKPGRMLTPKRFAFVGIAAVLFIGASVIFWHRRTAPRQDAGSPDTSSLPTRAKTEATTFRDKIRGEWTGTDGSGLHLDFQRDQVALGEDGVVASAMLPYQVDETQQSASFTVESTDGKKLVWTVKASKDERIYAQPSGSQRAYPFAREYTGGWHKRGEVDLGHRAPGMEQFDGADAAKRTHGGGAGSSAGPNAVAQLRLGMTPVEVKSIMGEPSGNMISHGVPEWEGQVLMFRYDKAGSKENTIVTFAINGRPTGGVTFVASHGTIVLNGTGER